jgi:threonine dehydrogenase-like Zn-dependent dehydrogenase
MKAVTWHGKRDVRVESVPDPKIEQPTDAIVEITSTNICGSDLHLYEVLGAFMKPGDILGHEPMGIVREVGAETGDLRVGDRIIVPFQISCGSCHMCDQKLFTQCETTQVRDQGMGAALFGYSEIYGEIPGGQAANCCESRRRNSPTSKSLSDRQIHGLSTCPTCCRRPGRRWHTQTSQTVGRWLYSAWVPSATWPRASPITSATASSPSTWCQNA